MKPRSVYNHALNLLARREHSRSELRFKLQRDETYQAEEIENALLRLTEAGLQSDSRFAESYVRYRSQRGMGAQRIRLELKERGVTSELIEQSLQEAEIDWFALAAEVRCKRFGERVPDDFKDRAKQQRFLQYRGFTHDQITESFNKNQHEK